MAIRSRSLVSRPQVAALTLAAAFLCLGAPAARAQLFNWDSALPPAQIERMIQASGYRLTGPVVRHGAVYLADVLGRQNDPERLIIDAQEGRLLQRFPAAAARRQATAVGGWSNEPQQTGSLFSWFMGDDDVDAPRPPAAIDSETGPQPLHATPAAPVHAPIAKEAARTDETSTPHVIMAPNFEPNAATRTQLLEKPRLRPQARHKRPELTPVAQPATAPNDGRPAPIVQPAAAPSATTPTASVGQPAAVPSVAPAAARVAPVQPAAPHVAETRVAPAAVAPAPVSKTSSVKPALNDVPVAPLE